MKARQVNFRNFGKFGKQVWQVKIKLWNRQSLPRLPRLPPSGKDPP